MAAPRPLLRWLAAVPAVAALLSLGPPAWADERAPERVRLRSGVVYDADSVEVQGAMLVLRLRLGAGGGRASFPMDRVEPADLLRILGPLTQDGDAAGQLRLARLALEVGRYAEAADRAARAAALDPGLGAAHGEIHAGIRSAHAQRALEEIEADLRAARPLAARERARALLEAGVPSVPTSTQAERALVLLRLAEALAAHKPTSPAPAPLPADPLLGPTPPAPGSALADADALATRGLAAREAAADPALPAPLREARLLGAADDLLHARRLLQALAQGPEVTARLDALRAWLVASWLDLADLARSAGQSFVALDRVQAALVLEPESERAWELRRWIEGDAAAPPLLVQEAPVAFYGGWFSSGWYAPGASWGAGGCPGPYAGGLRAHVHVGHHHGSSGGAHHNPGRRR